MIMVTNKANRPYRESQIKTFFKKKIIKIFNFINRIFTFLLRPYLTIVNVPSLKSIEQ